MAVTIDGDGTITGVSVGGLPDGIVDTDMLAADAVTDAKQSLSGAAKAWIVFDGGSSSIGTGDDSFNVSGVTDNGTGDYTITFSTAMSSANYAVVGMVANTINNYSAEAGGSSRGAQGIHIKGTVAPTASAVRVESRIQASAVSNGANADFSSVHVAVFGD